MRLTDYFQTDCNGITGEAPDYIITGLDWHCSLIQMLMLIEHGNFIYLVTLNILYMYTIHVYFIYIYMGVYIITHSMKIFIIYVRYEK